VDTGQFVEKEIERNDPIDIVNIGNDFQRLKHNVRTSDSFTHTNTVTYNMPE
jgi:hypothetical protein